MRRDGSCSDALDLHVQHEVAELGGLAVVGEDDAAFTLGQAQVLGIHAVDAVLGDPQAGVQREPAAAAGQAISREAASPDRPFFGKPDSTMVLFRWWVR